MTEVGLVWAQSTSGVIGRGGDIPWRVPEDLTRFKQVTMGHTVVMGRRTWDSLPAGVQPLPGRRNVVLSRQTGFMADGAQVLDSLEQAITVSETEPETWVIGGEQIYLLALPQATRCEVTEVEIDLPRDDNDALAPVLDETWLGETGEWLVSRSVLRYRSHSYHRSCSPLLLIASSPASGWCPHCIVAARGHERRFSASLRPPQAGGARTASSRRAVMSTLTAAQARRVAVAAQGFAEPKPAGPITRAHLKRLVARIQVLQLDSVSVAVRAHYAPVFSRLGPYERDVLDRAAWGPRSSRLLAEYWAHEAALMAVDDWPLLRWRMRQYRHGRWGTHIVKANPQLAEDIVAAVAELGPSTAGQIEAYLEAEPRGTKGPWWGRSDTKWVAEALFASGVLTTATRVGFARHYDLTERVVPPEVLARHIPDDEAIRELTLRAATALGVGTEADIRDYFRLSPKQIKPAVADLVASGELERVEVDGWSAPAYLRTRQTVPRLDRGTALLCPFDPLIFFRPRVERLFGFHYRIEIYTPARKRQYGYYVWPFLLDGNLAGRVDLKADRSADALHVVGAFVEEGQSPARVAEALAGELRKMADWLGLSEVTVGRRGDLAGALRAAQGR